MLSTVSCRGLLFCPTTPARRNRLLPDQDAILVAQIQEALVLAVVRAPHEVRVQLEQQLDVLLKSDRMGRHIQRCSGSQTGSQGNPFNGYGSRVGSVTVTGHHHQNAHPSSGRAERDSGVPRHAAPAAQPRVGGGRPRPTTHGDSRRAAAAARR